MNCPFCKADSRAYQDYYCGTKWYDFPAPGVPGFLKRSNLCYNTELAQLRTALAECQAREAEKIVWLKEAWLDLDYISHALEEGTELGTLIAVQQRIKSFFEPIPNIATHVLIPQAELEALREVENVARFVFPDRGLSVGEVDGWIADLHEALSNLDRVREGKDDTNRIP